MLKIKTINTYQLYRLLKEPLFEGYGGSAATVRKRAKAGTYSKLITLNTGIQNHYLIDLEDAYEVFKQTIKKEDYEKVINDWVN